MRILLILLSIPFAGISICQKPNYAVKSYLLTGHLNGRDSGIIVLWHPNISDVWIRDTVKLKNGAFTFAGKIDQPTFCVLKGSPRDGNYLNIFLEAGKQQIILQEDHFSKFKMNGSLSANQAAILNDQQQTIKQRFQNYYDNYDTLQKQIKFQNDNSLNKELTGKLSIAKEGLDSAEEEIRKCKIRFIKSHPASFVSTTELLGLLLSRRVETYEAARLYSSLDTVVKFGRIGRKIEDELEKRKINTTAVNFIALDDNGMAISLDQLKGSYVLIHFWASWCIPCLKEIPDLKKLYSDYKEKGLKILTISIDKNKKAWQSSIKDQKMGNWYNVIINDDITAKFPNAQLPIPSQILLDQQGVIIYNSANQPKDKQDDTKDVRSVLQKKTEPHLNQ
jgi:thiol-disulfide isomerase/thioredoxin